MASGFRAMVHRHILAYFICSFGLVAGQSTIYALKGKEVKIIPTIPGQPDDILWKHNGNKVVEFNGQEQQAYRPYEDRLTLDWHGAELSINQLTFEDSGSYELETVLNKVFKRSFYKLEVIDKVAKPTISCQMINVTQATLMCSAKSSLPQSLMKIEWSSHGIVRPGPNLTISLGDDDEVYSCDVSNPLTKDTATFTAMDCYPVADKSSSVGVIVGSIFAIIIVLVLLGLCFMFRRKRIEACRKKGKKESPDEEENRGFLDRAPTLPSNQRLFPSNKSSMNPNDSAREHNEVKNSDLNNVCVRDRIKHFECKEDQIKDNPSTPDSKPSSHPDVNTETAHHASKDKEEDADADKVKEPTEKAVSSCEEAPEQTAAPSTSSPIHEEEENMGETTSSGTMASTSTQIESAPLPSTSTTQAVPSTPALNHEEDNQEEEDMEETTSSGTMASTSTQIETAPLLSTDVTSTAQESEKKAEEDEGAMDCPANSVPPSPQRHSPSPQSSTPEDISVKPEEDVNSDQVTGETTENNHRESDLSDDSGKEKPTISDHKGSEATAHEQDANLTQGGTDTKEDNQQEMGKPVSQDDSKSVGEHEDIDKAQNQSVATSQNPECATLTTADNSNTCTSDVSPIENTHADPKQKGNTIGVSDQSKGQPDSTTADEGQSLEKKNEDQCGPKEEKPVNTSLNEDKEE
ncbi:CD48 antigen-like [Scomber scombrus]|uniref:CD48 antigen-like n=1 Tax=Scomber scombrus TaxID=13677 RepID=A0AAV1N653_SCOSC